jgi:hypothetical protein
VSDDPYAPPMAIVADPVTGSVAVAAPPQTVTLATDLLWVGFLLGALNSAIVGSLSTLPVSMVMLGSRLTNAATARRP